MEHRWGERVRVDLPVRLTAQPFSSKHGRITNLSVSGASIVVGFDVRLLSRIQVILEMPYRLRRDAAAIPAYVARSTKGGIGVEWCEFAPPLVSELLATLAARPYMRLRRPETPAVAVAVSRLSTPLLKHGT